MKPKESIRKSFDTSYHYGVTQGFPGGQGQPARTREAKLGCVFTQTGVDEEGYPARDLRSTTYVGAIETAEQFGKRLYVEAWKRAGARPTRKS